MYKRIVGLNLKLLILLLISFALMVILLVFTLTIILKNNQQNNLELFRNEFIESGNELLKRAANLFFIPLDSFLQANQSPSNNQIIAFVKEIDKNNGHVVIFDYSGRSLLADYAKPELEELFSKNVIDKNYNEMLLTNKTEFVLDNYAQFFADSNGVIKPVRVQFRFYESPKLIIGYGGVLNSSMVRVAYIQQTNREDTQRFLSLAMVIFLLGTCFILISTIFFMRTVVVNPLNQLARDFEHVTAGNWNVRIRISSNDEIGLLSQSFNFMVQQLKASFEATQIEIAERKMAEVALQKLNIELESRVAMRTQELADANTKLTILNADKDRFFSILAHDLKGPLMPLLGNAELLTEMGDVLPAHEVKDMGASIQKTARNIFSLLENLLQWARLQMGRMEYTPQRIDVSDVAAKSVELLSGNAELKEIELQTQVAHWTWVWADEHMLDTVIRNLVNNALKFTPPGGQVTIEASQIEDFIEVAIADTGVGMPPEVREKLFKLDQHVTTIGTGKETGTGLGLIICQEMVIKSGGRIWVESEVGQGTTVRFTIKLAEAAIDLSGQKPENKPIQLKNIPVRKTQKETFIYPPQDELNALLLIAQRGDMKAIKRKATEIAQIDSQYLSFTAKLHELAKDFEDEKIVIFIKQAIM